MAFSCLNFNSLFAEWNIEPTLSQLYTKQICVFDNGNIVAFTSEGYERQIRFSTNNGVSWDRTYPIPFVGQYPAGGCVIGDSTIIAIDGGKQFPSPTSHVVLSENNGKDWIEIDLPVQELILDICSKDGIVLLCGENGTLLISFDNGKSWEKCSMDNDFTLSDVFVVSSDIWLALRYDEKQLIKTIDGGKTWTVILNCELKPWKIESDATGIITISTLGEGFYISTDNSETWNFFDMTDNLVNKDYCSAVSFISPNVGIVGTAEANIFETNDGGSSWSLKVNEEDPSGYRLKKFVDIEYIENSLFIAAGQNIAYSKKLSTSIDKSIDNYKTNLYPNPTKPNSKVFVSIENNKFRNTTCKVFNLSGELIEGSQNIVMPKGCHTLDFETDGYITGTYFLVIESDGEILAREKFIVE